MRPMSPTAVPARADATEPRSAAHGVVADAQTLVRILVVKLSSLGDIVHALPLADALRSALPHVFLGWAVRQRWAPLLDGNPHLDAVYPLQGSRPQNLFSLGAQLRAQPFDAALDAQGLLLSGVVTRLSNARFRVGLDRNREGNAFWMTHPVVPAKARTHMVETLLGFCDALGVGRQAPRPQRYLADAEAARAGELLAGAGGGPVVGFIVGASTPPKRWPAGHWAELTRRLADQGARVVLLGGAGETEAATAIVREAGQSVALDLTGKTPLRVLASVLARCDVVVGGDSGPTHLAVAVGTPVVGLYGVTDPARTGPQWGPAAATVLDYNEAELPETRRPRHPQVRDALERIPVHAVAEATGALMSAAATPRSSRGS